MRVMVEEHQGTTPKALWLLIVVGPIITAIQHELNYILVGYACSVRRNVALYGVTLLAMVLMMALIIIGYGIWKRTRATWPGDAEDLETRVTFIAILGILSSATSLHIIIAQFIATIVFDACQL
jgi:hypothetical protein